MSVASKINPFLTLAYMQTENENKYFDRKSGQIRVADLAPAYFCVCKCGWWDNSGWNQR